MDKHDGPEPEMFPEPQSTDANYSRSGPPDLFTIFIIALIFTIIVWYVFGFFFEVNYG